MLASTIAFERLVGPVGMLDGEVPNIPRFVFTDPRARTALADWDTMADEWASALLPAANAEDPTRDGCSTTS